ncbi:MAG TPA: GNAT family N-acetyltransferase [Kiritimatiellia bacterium]|nr:GNAT family N-acetyltransferase [Kiritimatiellia bacterium]
MSARITIAKLNWPTSLLGDVMALHRQNAKKLGFFPAGAFEEYARLQRILVATEGDKLVGYLLYRVARGRAAIVHLCVSQSARGRGVATLLVQSLKAETKHLEGIGLRCRRDYDINHVWAKFGFEALLSKAGRGKDGAELTYWWFGHGHADLFSLAAEPDPVRQRVVIDANVFYDLFARETLASEDSKALLADWVQSSIELVITKELRNEIENAPSDDQRRASRAEASRYHTLASDDEIFQRLCAELRSLFPQSTTLRDDADLRQIAYAIAGGAPFLVTRDQNLVDRSEPLYRSHGLMVLHPSELINHLDSIEREADYKPARIEGSRWKGELLRAEKLPAAVDVFKYDGERVGEFTRSLRSCLAQPRSVEVQLISDGSGDPVVLGVMDRSEASVFRVPVLRRQLAHPTGATMLRNFLRACLDAAATEGRSLVIILDSEWLMRDASIVSEFGFVRCGDAAAKLTARGIGTRDEMARLLASISVHPMYHPAKQAAITSLLAFVESGHAVQAAAAMERQLWPMKVIGADVPTFIVSIQPKWAQHFFDVGLASQLLFGLREELHLGVEGAYYRSAENNNMGAPGRVLWYVSRGDGDGSMTIKACSQLEEVAVAKPKELFRRFRRLGVYEWNDVLSMANGDISADLVAFRFRMTERFKTPVEMRSLETLGIRAPFMSPRRITEEQFAAIYRTGMSTT